MAMGNTTSPVAVSLIDIATGSNPLIAGALPVNVNNAQLPVNVQNSIVAVQRSVTYTQVNTNNTIILKTGSGSFYGIIITAIGVLSTVTVYDGTDTNGTKLSPTGIVTTALGLLGLGIPQSIGVNFNTGLTIVTAGTSPATLLVLWS